MEYERGKEREWGVIGKGERGRGEIEGRERTGRVERAF